MRWIEDEGRGMTGHGVERGLCRMVWGNAARIADSSVFSQFLVAFLPNGAIPLYVHHYRQNPAEPKK